MEVDLIEETRTADGSPRFSCPSVPTVIGLEGCIMVGGLILDDEQAEALATMLERCRHARSNTSAAGE